MPSLTELNRLLSFEDIVANYGGPLSVWEKLRPGLPVFCTHDGEPIYLESVVDAFLMALADGLQTNGPRSVPEFGSSGSSSEAPPEYVSVADAQRRYLGGTKSVRWWYRRVELLQIAHHRVGESIVLRTEDIERFIAESRKEQQAAQCDDVPSEAPLLPVVPTAKNQPRRKPEEDPSRFRFFPRR